ncbi:MAG: EFR1 family ferrodoxin [Lachnospiraceae bacterium]|nr:EFR1 family ferrodoxin [Lachnospiraceae bacterium]
MIFYFSGTGNTYFAARKLAEALNDTAVNILKFKDMEEVVCEDDVIGFVYPVYGSDCPMIYKRFLRKLKCRKDVYAFAVATLNKVDYGSMNSIDEALCENGAGLSYSAWLYMPGNCMVSPDKVTKERLATAEERLSAIAGKVRNQVINYTSKGKGIPEDFLKLELGPESALTQFEILDSCDGCGVCAAICPTDNIRIENGKAVHGKDCTICFACFHWCPKQATKLKTGFKELDERSQYTHPEMTAAKLIRDKQGE